MVEPTPRQKVVTIVRGGRKMHQLDYEAKHAAMRTTVLSENQQIPPPKFDTQASMETK